jgi:hypothetical protein
MLGSGWARRLRSVLAVVACLALPARAEEIQDWPCEVPLAERFVAEEVWGGPLPGPLPTDWQSYPAAAEVVAFAASPENRPTAGAAAIERLAARLGAGRRDVLLAVLAGLLDEFNALRGYVIGGVRDFVVRAKIVQEALDANEAALAALPRAGGAAVEQQRTGYREARAFDARTQDDALEEAEFLCRRYAYLEEKLRHLAAAIRAAL